MIRTANPILPAILLCAMLLELLCCCDARGFQLLRPLNQNTPATTSSPAADPGSLPDWFENPVQEPVFVDRPLVQVQLISESELRRYFDSNRPNRPPAVHMPPSGATALIAPDAFPQFQYARDESVVEYPGEVAQVAWQQPSAFAFAGMEGWDPEENGIRSTSHVTGHVTGPGSPEEGDRAGFMVLPSGAVVPMGALWNSIQNPALQETEPDNGEVSATELKRRIEEHRNIIERDLQVSDAERAEWLDVLSRAAAELHRNGTYEENIRRYERELDSFPAELDSLKSELAMNPVSRPLIPDDPQQDPAHLQVQLEAHRQELHDLHTRLSTVKHDIEIQRERITSIAGLRSEGRELQQEIRQKLARATHDDEKSAVNEILLQAGFVTQTNRLKMLNVEVKWQELAGKVLPMRRDSIQRRIRITEEEVNQWQETIAVLKRNEIEKQAEEAYQQTIAADPSLRELAQGNRDLTSRRIELTEWISNAEQEKNLVNRRVEDVSTRLDAMTSRIEAADEITGNDGAMFVENLRTLLPPFESRVRIDEISNELQQINLEVLQLQERRKPLSDLPGFVDAHLKGHSANSLMLDDLRHMTMEIAETRRQYLDDLIADYDQYRRLLSDLATRRSSLAGKTIEARRLIDTHALWIRSSATISTADVAPTVDGVKAFFDGGAWAGLGTELRDSLLHKPQRTALWVISLLGLVLVTGRIKPRRADQPRSSDQPGR